MAHEFDIFTCFFLGSSICVERRGFNGKSRAHLRRDT